MKSLPMEEFATALSNTIFDCFSEIYNYVNIELRKDCIEIEIEVHYRMIFRFEEGIWWVTLDEMMICDSDLKLLQEFLNERTFLWEKDATYYFERKLTYLDILHRLNYGLRHENVIGEKEGVEFKVKDKVITVFTRDLKILLSVDDKSVMIKNLCNLLPKKYFCVLSIIQMINRHCLGIEHYPRPLRVFNDSCESRFFKGGRFSSKKRFYEAEIRYYERELAEIQFDFCEMVYMKSKGEENEDELKKKEEEMIEMMTTLKHTRDISIFC